MKNIMPVRACAVIFLCALLLSGCGSFLNREYSASEPHSAAYYGDNDRSVMQIESYQDLVNALLMLISQRAAEATIWYYPSRSTPNAAEAMARACNEVQQETPLGAYAVDYLSYTQDDSSHNYSVMRLTIGYRRSAEQVSAIVHATSVSALYDLLSAAASRGGDAVAVQVNVFDQSREEIRLAVAAMQLAQFSPGTEPSYTPPEPGQPEEPQEDPPEEPRDPVAELVALLPEGVAPWQVSFYPAESAAGIVEVVLAG